MVSTAVFALVYIWGLPPRPSDAGRSGADAAAPSFLSCLVPVSLANHVFPSSCSLEKAYRLLNHGPSVLVTSAHEGQRNVMAAAWSATGEGFEAGKRGG